MHRPSKQQPTGFSLIEAAVAIGIIAVEGGLLHIANHAFAKITLFFCAGAIYVTAHKKNISEMSGLGRTMPVTFTCFGLASLGMIGAPPVGGFVSKLYLLVGSMDAGAIGILCILIVSTILNAAYFAPVVYKAFFGQVPAADHAHGHDEHGHHAGEAHLSMLIPICITAAISVALGFYPNLFLDLAKAVL